MQQQPPAARSMYQQVHDDARRAAPKASSAGPSPAAASVRESVAARHSTAETDSAEEEGSPMAIGRGLNSIINVDGLQGLSCEELKRALRARGLPVSGLKSDLIARLAAVPPGTRRRHQGLRSFRG